MVQIEDAGPIDPAIPGPPSPRPLTAEDPIWQPINGISLQAYAELARDSRVRGIKNEAAMAAFAQESRGWDLADTTAAIEGWVQRIHQSMAVGLQARRFFGS